MDPNEQEHEFDSQELKRLRDSEIRYRRLFETAQDGILILDGETGQINDVNPFLIDMLGYSKEEFLGKRLWEIGPFKDAVTSIEAFRELQRQDYIRYEDLPLQTIAGELIQVEFVSNVYQVDHQKVIQCNIRDITLRKQAENVRSRGIELREYAVTHTFDELLQRVIDLAEGLTSSTIGFFHLYNADQIAQKLEAWSTNTIENICKTGREGAHYPVMEEGVWSKCILQRQPIIHNDYPSLPQRKGLPEGHPALIRELVVPILQVERVVGLLGVGNKPVDYNEIDIKTVTELGNLAWDLIFNKINQAANRKPYQISSG